MDIYIKAPQDFEDFLKKNNYEYSIRESSIDLEEDVYNANFSAKKQIFIGVAVSLISSGAKELGNMFMEYLKTPNKEIVVTTENDQYIITQSNVKDITPIVYNDWVASLNEENNGKNR